MLSWKEFRWVFISFINKINNGNIIIKYMSDPQSGDSDHEGFIPNLLQIKPFIRQPEDKSKSQHHIFQPHYIEGTPMLRKETKESYEYIHDVPVLQKNSEAKCANRIKIQWQKETAFQKYSNPSAYCNVYSRLKEPLICGQRPFENQVKLKSAFSMVNRPIYRNLREPDLQKNRQQPENVLIIDSKFECGNLISAFRNQKQPNTYELMMQSDTNTYGYSQWFYFSIRNTKPKVLYTFRIVNFKKSYSFFKVGMKPVVFSLVKANKQGNGWYRDGQNVQFYQSNFRQNNQTFYTLEFQISFQHQNDYVTLSPYPPYSYSKLIHSLKNFEQEAINREIYFQIKSIGRSLGGNNTPYIKCSKTKDKNKPSIVIIARQHSGEVWSSYLLDQLLRFLLLKNSVEGDWLLQTFNLHIFPMINVDGVIYGNFRCDLAGYDLNRCWKDPSPTIHPQIYKIKQILQQISEQSKIEVCLDLHTHSRDLGVFAYCCSEEQTFRAVPSLISKLTSLFRYRACTFSITKYKQTTARAFLYELTRSSNVITIQMSTYGFRSFQTKSLAHFSITHIESLAKALIEAIYCNANAIEVKNQKQSISEEELYNEDQNVPVSGSDSEPEADQIQLKTRLKKILPKSLLDQLLLKRRKINKKTMNRFRNTQKMHVKTVSQVQKQMKNTRYVPKNQKNIYSAKNKEVSSNSLCLQSSLSKNSPENKTSASKSFRPFHFSFQFPITTYTNSKFFKEKKKQEEKQKVDYQPLNTMDFSLKKLPIFASDTLPDSYKRILNQNQSLMLATMALPNKFIEKKMKIQKTGSVHSAFAKGQSNNYISVSEQKKQVKNIEQFPFLCIMSQNKRQAHLQKIRERRQKKALNRTHGDIDSAVQQLEMQCVERKNQNQSILRKLAKERSGMNMETVSKKWAENCQKYKMNIRKQ